MLSGNILVVILVEWINIMLLNVKSKLAEIAVSKWLNPYIITIFSAFSVSVIWYDLVLIIYTPASGSSPEES